MHKLQTKFSFDQRSIIRHNDKRLINNEYNNNYHTNNTDSIIDYSQTYIFHTPRHNVYYEDLAQKISKEKTKLTDNSKLRMLNMNWILIKDHIKSKRHNPHNIRSRLDMLSSEYNNIFDDTDTKYMNKNHTVSVDTPISLNTNNRYCNIPKSSNSTRRNLKQNDDINKKIMNIYDPKKNELLLENRAKSPNRRLLKNSLLFTKKNEKLDGDDNDYILKKDLEAFLSYQKDLEIIQKGILSGHESSSLLLTSLKNIKAKEGWTDHEIHEIHAKLIEALIIANKEDLEQELKNPHEFVNYKHSSSFQSQELAEIQEGKKLYHGSQLAVEEIASDEDGSATYRGKDNNIQPNPKQTFKIKSTHLDKQTTSTIETSIGFDHQASRTHQNLEITISKELNENIKTNEESPELQKLKLELSRKSYKRSSTGKYSSIFSDENKKSDTVVDLVQMNTIINRAKLLKRLSTHTFQTGYSSNISLNQDIVNQSTENIDKNSDSQTENNESQGHVDDLKNTVNTEENKVIMNDKKNVSIDDGLDLECSNIKSNDLHYDNTSESLIGKDNNHRNLNPLRNNNNIQKINIPTSIINNAEKFSMTVPNTRIHGNQNNHDNEVGADNKVPKLPIGKHHFLKRKTNSFISDPEQSTFHHISKLQKKFASYYEDDLNHDLMIRDLANSYFCPDDILKDQKNAYLDKFSLFRENLVSECSLPLGHTLRSRLSNPQVSDLDSIGKQAQDNNDNSMHLNTLNNKKKNRRVDIPIPIQIKIPITSTRQDLIKKLAIKNDMEKVKNNIKKIDELDKKNEEFGKIILSEAFSDYIDHIKTEKFITRDKKKNDKRFCSESKYHFLDNHNIKSIINPSQLNNINVSLVKSNDSKNQPISTLQKNSIAVLSPTHHSHFSSIELTEPNIATETQENTMNTITLSGIHTNNLINGRRRQQETNYSATEIISKFGTKLPNVVENDLLKHQNNSEKRKILPFDIQGINRMKEYDAWYIKPSERNNKLKKFYDKHKIKQNEYKRHKKHHSMIMQDTAKVDPKNITQSEVFLFGDRD